MEETALNASKNNGGFDPEKDFLYLKSLSDTFAAENRVLDAPYGETRARVRFERLARSSKVVVQVGSISLTATQEGSSALVQNPHEQVPEQLTYHEGRIQEMGTIITAVARHNLDSNPPDDTEDSAF